MTFQSGDVFLPSADELLGAPGELEGTVVAFSDSGNRSRVFAVVEVVRKQEVVVPVEKLRVIGTREE